MTVIFLMFSLSLLFNWGDNTLNMVFDDGDIVWGGLYFGCDPDFSGCFEVDWFIIGALLLTGVWGLIFSMFVYGRKLQRQIDDCYLL
jgi:hypothetical protein